jgi:subtilisin
MAEQKDDLGQTAKVIQSRKPTQSSGTAEQFAAVDRVANDGRPESTAGTADKISATVVRRKQRYLIGFRSLPGAAPVPSDPFLERLAEMDGVEIIRRLRGRDDRPAAAAPGAPPAGEIVVARMDEQRGEALRQNAPAHVIVEIDAPLRYSDMAVPEPMSWQHAVQTMPFPRPRRELRFRILGDGDRPLANSVVNLFGHGFPTQSITDSSGQASLQIDAADGSGIHAVYVRPAADHWERYIGPRASQCDSFDAARPDGRKLSRRAALRMGSAHHEIRSRTH